MTVTFKAPVESQVVNDAFVSKSADDTKSGKLTLNKVSEGTTVQSVQKAVNDLFDAQGTSEDGANNKVYTTNNKVADGDSQKECIEKFDVAIQANEDDLDTHEASVTAHPATNITYDDTTSGNGQTTVQGAIDDNESRVQAIEDAKAQPNGYASLDGSGRIPNSQLSLSAVELKGTFDPVGGSPALSDGTGTQGDTYIVSADGSYDFGSGTQTMLENDEVVYISGIWEVITGGKVRSFNGRTGDVTPQSGDYNATDVGLGNVTNDAQLKRAAADFNSFTEKVTPVEDDIVLIEDSSGSSFVKKKVKLANLLGGGGGGGSFVWELNGDASPFESIQSGISTLDFDDVSDAEMYALLTIPDSYSDGDQILLQGIKYFTDQTTNNVFFRTETQLLKATQDMSALPITGHTSSNTEVTLTGAANILRETGDLDLTDSSGLVNGVAATASDTLLVKFYRSNSNETISAAGDCRVLKFSASVKFDA